MMTFLPCNSSFLQYLAGSINSSLCVLDMLHAVTHLATVNGNKHQKHSQHASIFSRPFDRSQWQGCIFSQPSRSGVATHFTSSYLILQRSSHLSCLKSIYSVCFIPAHIHVTTEDVAFWHFSFIQRIHEWHSDFVFMTSVRSIINSVSDKPILPPPVRTLLCPRMVPRSLWHRHVFTPALQSTRCFWQQGSFSHRPQHPKQQSNCVAQFWIALQTGPSQPAQFPSFKQLG